MRKLLIYTDGASRGNPGPAGIGIVICDESGKIVKGVNYFHVPREEEHLKRADKLANRAIDDFRKFKIMGGKGGKEMDKEDAWIIIKRARNVFNLPILLNHALIEWFENNAIMHCRAQYLSEETISKLKESCIELQKLIEKVNGEK